MNKSFSSFANFAFGVALAVAMLVPSHGYSRGGRGNWDNSDRPTPAPAAPKPTPALVPVQGVITNVTPFAVSIQGAVQTVTLTFKVGRESAITVDGRVAALAELKPGMSATITPTSDHVYAGSIAASAPVAAAPVPPMPETVPAPPVMQSAQGVSSSSPFGQRMMP